VLFLNIYHCVGLGKDNCLVLAYNWESEVTLLFFTIAPFPCFSQIKQNVKPNAERCINLGFFSTPGHLKTNHLMYKFYRATIAHFCEVPCSLRLKFSYEPPKLIGLHFEPLLCFGQNIRTRADVLTPEYVWREKKDSGPLEPAFQEFLHLLSL